MKNVLQLLIFLGAITVVKAQTSSNTCVEAENATQITGPGTFSVGDIDGTSAGSGFVCTSGNIVADNSEWFAYTATEAASVTVSSDLPVNGDKDTRLQIYTGTCSNLNCFAGDNDGGDFEGTNGLSYLSVATFLVTAGETYYIVWDNRYSSGDNFQFEVTEDPVPPIAFEAQSISTSGTRRAAVDMNGDFLDDIVTIPINNESPSQAIGVNVYYQQPDGTINTTAAEYLLPTPTYRADWSLAAGDYDGNGFNDLVFGTTNGVSIIQANGSGTAYTIANTDPDVFTQRTNFVDFNNDGHLDVFVCHDQDPNVYYINDGSNNLTYYKGQDPNGIPEGLGLYPSGGHYGSIFIDYDNDRDMDLFIAKCGGELARYTDNLFRNNANTGSSTSNTLSYTDVGGSSGIDANPTQTWSSAWGDYDNDGDMDVFIGSSSFPPDTSTQDPFDYIIIHKLMRNNGDGTFTDIADTSGVLLLDHTGIENTAHDFNNDGFIDILSNGRILMNNGDFTFTEIPSLGLPQSNAVGDLNNDGYLDVYGSQIHYNASSYSGNNWLKVYTIGKSYDTANRSNRNGIGARVEVNTVTLGTQIRDVRSGEGFRYMGSLNTHFGIGDETTINTVTVYWPSGVVDLVVNPPINSAITIIEGDTLGLPESGIEDFILFPNPTKDLLNFNTSFDFIGANYAVFDINGKRVLNGNLESHTLDVSTIASGNYILRIISNGQQTTQKFIKQ